MRKSILPFVVAGICTAAAAENDRVHDGDVLKRGRDRQALMKAAVGAAGMPSAADVGDAESFGRNVHFLGVAQSGLVQILPPGACPPPDPNFPDDRCVEANPNASVDARDIGRMKLPGKAANSILCHSITTLPFWEFSNFTGGRVFAFFNYLAGVTIENEVLNDPSATGTSFLFGSTTADLRLRSKRLTDCQCSRVDLSSAHAVVTIDDRHPGQQ